MAGYFQDLFMGAVQKIYWIEWKNKIKSITSFVNSTIVNPFSLQYIQYFLAGIIILNNPQMQVLLENTTSLLHKNVRIAGIIRVAGIIRGRALYEEIRYTVRKSRVRIR